MRLLLKRMQFRESQYGLRDKNYLLQAVVQKMRSKLLKGGKFLSTIQIKIQEMGGVIQEKGSFFAEKMEFNK